MTCPLCNDTGDQRYWEARWRDADAEIAKLRAALHGLVSAIANDQTSDSVLRSRVYAEAQQLCSSEQLTPQAFIEAKKERDDGWPEFD